MGGAIAIETVFNIPGIGRLLVNAVARRDYPVIQGVVLFMALTFVVFIVYGVCAAATRHYVLTRPRVLRWLRYGFAGTFGVLGLRLALSDRS